MKRSVQKITPSQQIALDQQFWPVLVAITVLCGIAMGAVLTLLHGTWMWGSLVGLPLLSAVAIGLLYQVDNQRLRRSFQIAIILSLAAHMLVLILVSVTHVFGNPFSVPERAVAQRQVRTIEISDQRAAFVWEQVNARETPEPEVDPEKRQNEPTTDVQPQPVPVESTKSAVAPQLKRRDSPQSTVPKQNPELSRLRKQTANVQPLSSVKMTGEFTKTAANSSSAAAAKANVEPSESRESSELARRENSQPAEVQPAAMKASPNEPVAETAPGQAAARRARPAENVEFSPAVASSSTARIRRSTPNLPSASESAATPTPEVTRAETTRPTAAEATRSASQLTRRERRDSPIQPTQIDNAQPQLTRRTELARAVQRRTAESQRPSISNPASVTTQPRRSTNDAVVASSPIAIENPARSSESDSPSREINAKTLSITRSESGSAGVGQAANLERFAGGQTSPATRASDSARRPRTMSQPSEVRLLSSSQTSEVRRTSGSVAVPQTAFRADTDAAARIAGSSQPTEISMESSAAQLTSASTVHRDEVSAEMGSAMMDLGPTKVVEDRELSPRRSGGGQPEVAQFSPEMTRRSRDRSREEPSLAADTGVEVAAPRELSAAPSSATTVSPSAQASVDSRAGGEATSSIEQATAEELGKLADQGSSDIEQRIAEAAETGRREREASGQQFESDLDEDEDEQQRGRTRDRIATAPMIRSDPGSGLARNEGAAETDQGATGEELLAARATELGRRSTSDTTGASAAPLSIEQPAPSEGIGSAAGMGSESRRAQRRVDQAGVAPTAIAENRRRGETGRETSPLRPTASGQAVPEMASAANGSGRSEDEPLLEAAAVDVARSESRTQQQPEGMDLDVLAMEGPAGLGDKIADDVGVLERPASEDSPSLMPDLNTRFRNREYGGVPSVNPDAVLAREAFRDREPASRSRAADPSTEAAIQLGLEFLARYQAPDGSWSLKGFDRASPLYMNQLDSDTAATGLALLAFQGAGYNHREYKYARQMDRAIEWLINHQASNGRLYLETDNRSNDACRMYSHGIATLALTEAYGMTQDPKLKEPAQKAIDYIVETQDQRSGKGGWRYFAEVAKRSTDTSVTGWMMMALQSGRLAGLKVPRATFDGIDDWLDTASDPENPSLYRYNPYAADAQGISRVQGREHSPSMTSVGLLMRIYSGWRKDDPRLIAGVEHLLQTQLPDDSTQILRDTYYWYYATQVLKHVGGDAWEQWDAKLRPLLTRSQEKTGELAGSWHPYRPVPDRWGAVGGRLYVTTMNLLSLEVRHRLLPLYQQEEEPMQILGIIETGELLSDQQVARIRNGETLAPDAGSPSDLPSAAGQEAFVATSEPQVVVGTWENPDPINPSRNADRTPVSVPDMLRASHPADSIEIGSVGQVAFIETKNVALDRGSPPVELDADAVGPKLDSESHRALVDSGVAAPSPSRSVKGVRSFDHEQMTAAVSQTARRSAAELPLLAAESLNIVVEGESGKRDGRLAVTSDRPIEEVTKQSLVSLVRKQTSALAEPFPEEDLEVPSLASTEEVVFRPADVSYLVPARRLGVEVDAAPTEMVTAKRHARSVGIVSPKMQPSPAVETKPAIVFGEVVGKVTLDGEVLASARVTFVPVESPAEQSPKRKAVTALTNRLGQYSITAENTQNGRGLRAGKYLIRITTTRPAPEINVIEMLEVVPKKYNRQSTLKVSIVGESRQTADWKLESEVR